MPSEIQTCSYGATSASLLPLHERKVERLNQSGTYDIRAKVATIVTQHLRYTGTAEYDLTLKNKKVVFVCEGKTRTLELQSDNTWKLNIQGQVTTSSSPLELQSDLTEVITKVRLLATEKLEDPKDSSSVERRLDEMQRTLETLKNTAAQSQQNPLGEISKQILQLTQTLTTRAPDTAGLEQRLAKLETALEKLSPPQPSPEIADKLEQLQEQVAGLQQALNNGLEKKLDQLQQEVQQLKTTRPQTENSSQLPQAIRDELALINQKISILIDLLSKRPDTTQLQERLRQLEEEMRQFSTPQSSPQLKKIEQRLDELTHTVTQKSSSSQSSLAELTHAIQNLQAQPPLQPEVIKKLDEISLAIQELAQALTSQRTTPSSTDATIREFTAYIRQIENGNRLMYDHLQNQQRMIEELRRQLAQLKSEIAQKTPDQPSRSQTISSKNSEVDQFIQETRRIPLNYQSSTAHNMQLNPVAASSVMQIKVDAQPDLSNLPKAAEKLAQNISDLFTIDPLQSQIEKLQTELQQTQQDRTTLRSQLSESTLQIETLQTQLRQAQKDQKQTSEQIDTLSSQLNESSLHIVDLELQLNDLNKQNTSLNNGLRDKASEVEKLQSLLATAQTEAQTAAAKHRQTLAQLEEKYQHLQKQLQETEQQLKQTQTGNASQVKQLKELEAQKVQLESSLSAKVLETQRLFSQIQQDKTLSEQTAHKHQETIHQLQHTIAQNQKEMTQLKAQQETAAQVLDNLHRHLDQTKTSAAETTQKLREAEEKARQDALQIQTLNDNLIQKSLTMTELETHLATQEKKLLTTKQQMQEQIQALQTEHAHTLQQFQAELTQIQSNKTLLQTQLTELEAEKTQETSQHNQEIAQLKAQQETHAKALCALQQSLADTQSTAAKTEEQAKLYAWEIQQLKQTLEQSQTEGQTQLQQKETTITGLHNQLNTLEQKLRETQAKVENLTLNLNQSQAELTQAKTAAAQTAQKLDDAKAHIKTQDVCLQAAIKETFEKRAKINEFQEKNRALESQIGRQEREMESLMNRLKYQEERIKRLEGLLEDTPHY